MLISLERRFAMKSALVALSLVAFTPLWLPYGSLVPHEHGNPNWNTYVGTAGSTYDSTGNPAQTIGTVSYNPMAALPTVAPSAPSGSGAVTTPP
jgi:hypothetical protein